VAWHVGEQRVCSDLGKSRRRQRMSHSPVGLVYHALDSWSKFPAYQSGPQHSITRCRAGRSKCTWDRDTWRESASLPLCTASMRFLCADREMKNILCPGISLSNATSLIVLTRQMTDPNHHPGCNLHSSLKQEHRRLERKPKQRKCALSNHR